MVLDDEVEGRVRTNTFPELLSTVTN
jgi:hypothetical protein